MHATRLDVLLLSESPLYHRDGLLALRRRGLRVRVARGKHQALRRLLQSPAMVLVDLASSTPLDGEVVARLNRMRGPTMVLALHEGRLGDGLGEMANLNVDGFCRAHDWHPLERIAPAPGYAHAGLPN